MKNKKINKRIWVVCIVVLLVFACIYAIIGNPIVAINNSKLEQSFTAITAETVAFNEIVPFDWDMVYTFEPYTSKAEIEAMIGFKSNAIQESISEGMVQLLFVKNNKVVAGICTYASNLGYSVNFADKILYSDNAVFRVQKEAGIVQLSHIK